MSDKTTEQAYPNPKPVEETPVRGSQARQVRRPFLTPTGRVVRDVVLATAITGAAIAGSNIVKDNIATGQEPTSAPSVPAKVLERQSLAPLQEANPNIIRVGDFHPGKPPTEKLNGTVTVIINKEDNLPVPRTSPRIDGADNATSWLQISEINKQSVTKAVDSNGQVELILTDPLITATDSGIGSWVTMVGTDGKPLYLFAGQETVGIVKEAPRGGKEDVFSPVPPTANALDFGKVSFQNTPPATSSQ